MPLNHTPGPWTVEIDRFDDPLVVSGTGKPIAAIGSLDSAEAARQQDLADARLIAAAPELYAAAVDLMQQFDVVAEAIDSQKEYSLDFDRLKAAIAKAEGRDA